VDVSVAQVVTMTYHAQKVGVGANIVRLGVLSVVFGQVVRPPSLGEDGISLLSRQVVLHPHVSVDSNSTLGPSVMSGAYARPHVSLLTDQVAPQHGHHRQTSLLTNLVTFPQRLYNRIAVNVTYNGLVEELYTFPERRPRLFNVLMATTKTWLADLIVQVGEGRMAGRGSAFDWKRSGAFALFGFLYVGIVQWFLYVTVFTIVCPNAIRFANSPWEEKLHDRAGQMDLVKQVCYDNFLLETLIYFPVFYIIKESVNGNTPSKEGAEVQRRSLGGAVHNGLAKYIRNFKQDNLASWAVWVPADVVVYAVPMFMRMPLDHMVSFGWTMLLSHMRGGEKH